MGDHNHQQQGRNNGANGLDLPPGFRFHPTDEEIITSYLRPRVLDQNFTTLAVGDADLNKSEPWELPCKIPYLYTPICFITCELIVLESFQSDSEHGGEGVVLLLSKRPQVPNW